MRLIAAILITFFIRCVYLYPSDPVNEINFFSNVLNESCVFGPKSMSMIIFNSANLEGKNIGVEESCNYLESSKPIVFVVHGFISYANTTIGYDVATQFVKNGYIVFLIDWSETACKNGIPVLRLFEYPSAAQSTREIGDLMAKYVMKVLDDCKIPLANITFIGHSLGAHVCAFAAKKIQKYGKIGRLIGLDPANPMFGNNKCDARFCKTDATHVIAFHTSILGIPQPIGHMDLQFNGGIDQPGCGLDFVCSHSRAFDYVNVINDYAYPGVPIKSSIFRMFERPPYPTANTTDCILITDKIYSIKPSEKLKEGNYYVFVDSKFPYSTRKSFSCPLITDN